VGDCFLLWLGLDDRLLAWAGVGDCLLTGAGERLRETVDSFLCWIELRNLPSSRPPELLPLLLLEESKLDDECLLASFGGERLACFLLWCVVLCCFLLRQEGLASPVLCFEECDGLLFLREATITGDLALGFCMSFLPFFSGENLRFFLTGGGDGLLLSLSLSEDTSPGSL